MNLQLTPAQRRIELARPWVLLGIYIVLAAAGWWWLAVPLVVVCLAAFVQMHDAMHNALGLSKAANKRVLSLSGLLILKSGHGLQVMHLRHHGRCLTEADPEGAPATWSFGRVLWQGPWHTLMLRREALRIAPAPSKSSSWKRPVRWRCWRASWRCTGSPARRWDWCTEPWRFL